MFEKLRDRLQAQLLEQTHGGRLRQLLSDGAALHQANRLDDAAHAYREALKLAPAHHIAVNNLATVDMARGAVDAAIAGFRQALALRPDANRTRANLAWALQVRGSANEAIDAWRDVLHRDPGNNEAKSMLGMLLLWSGDFSAFSWDCYAARKLDGQEAAAGFPQPKWDGSDLRGKSIVVYGHDGVGDEINFASCVPDLLAQGANVTLACSGRLVGLMQRSFPAARVLELQAEAAGLRSAAFDYQSSLGRLHRYLRLRREDFGGGAPYLSADPSRVAAWRERLDRLGPGPKIVLSWRGGNARTTGRDRSVPLALWSRVLAIRGVHWISLQYGDCAAELAEVKEKSGTAIHHFQDAVDDFDECAAALMAVDGVATVTTTLAHLCGALGREAWVLVNARPHWRWQSQGERMPWYASLRLVRQAQDEAWPAVLDRLTAQIEDHTRAR